MQPPSATDYAPAYSDEGVLLKPLKEELAPVQVQFVFNFPRDLSEKYTLGNVLGAGSFGVVREALEIATGKKYACKTIPKNPKRGKCTPRYLLKLQSEVDAMVQLGTSLDAVFLKDVFEDNENVHLVMEVCTGGSILDRLERERYTERRVATIMRSIFRFIAQCHAKGLIYRDVKPDNFLFSTADPDSAVKATDFGLSIRHWPWEEAVRSRSGTPAYMAPEVVCQEYDQRCDLWSAGILMYQLLTGKFPFWENVRSCTLQEVWKAILNEEVDLESSDVKNAMSEPARDLLSRLLQRNPDLRPSAAEVLEHPWIKNKETAPDMPLGGSVVQRLQRFATYGHLKQMVLKMIADELEGNRGDGAPSPADGAVSAGDALERFGMDLAQMKQLFAALDSEGSGRVQGAQLAQGLRQLGYDVVDTEGEQLLAGLDVNHDGNVTFDEFAACLVDWRQLQENKRWAEWVELAFNKFDANQDGYIGLDELMAQLSEQETQSERLLEAKRMLREADLNGDGRISREEFCDLLVGSTVPDTLMQYDPRIRSHAVDEDLQTMDVV